MIDRVTCSAVQAANITGAACDHVKSVCMWGEAEGEAGARTSAQDMHAIQDNLHSVHQTIRCTPLWQHTT